MALTPAEKQRRYRERLKGRTPPRHHPKAPGPALAPATLARRGERTAHAAGALARLPRHPPGRAARHPLWRTPADHRRRRHRGPRGDRTAARLRTRRMIPATPLNDGNVTGARARRRALAPPSPAAPQARPRERRAGRGAGVAALRNNHGAHTTSRGQAWHARAATTREGHASRARHARPGLHMTLRGAIAQTTRSRGSRPPSTSSRRSAPGWLPW